MSNYSDISQYQHRKLEQRALVIKIEKLQRWLRLYQDEKIGKFQNPIEIMIMIHEAELELIKLTK